VSKRSENVSTADYFSLFVLIENTREKNEEKTFEFE